MRLNSDKSKITKFRNGGLLRQYERWFFIKTAIEVVSFYSYIGSFLVYYLCWIKTKNTLLMQAKKAADSIFHYNTYFGNFHHHEAFKLFDNCQTYIAILGRIFVHLICDKIECAQIPIMIQIHLTND